MTSEAYVGPEELKGILVLFFIFSQNLVSSPLVFMQFTRTCAEVGGH